MSRLKKRKLKETRGLTLTLVFMLICGCATPQHFKSVHSSHVVASCIAKEWEQGGMSGYKIPVIIKKQTNGYFVGVALGVPLFTLPSGTKHSTYPVWAEVIDTDTDSGSVTKYHRAYQIFHGRIDKAVCECQEPNQ